MIDYVTLAALCDVSEFERASAEPFNEPQAGLGQGLHTGDQSSLVISCYFMLLKCYFSQVAQTIENKGLLLCYFCYLYSVTTRERVFL